jgi:membrane-associated phospholipid phosphatase
VLFVLFMWKRLNKWWRPLLVAYPIVMQFSLTYGGDHYVADGIAGALCAWLVHSLANRIERRRKAATAPDTLEPPPEQTLETPCPPTHPQPAQTQALGLSPETTPSST